mmetsp:Transcript_58187/g.173099  ORF Transcript_58187/g.173099 Transcript_58187/m.173099 type:complete len:270 (-) Transcript_58187:46-855(-)
MPPPAQQLMGPRYDAAKRHVREQEKLYRQLVEEQHQRREFTLARAAQIEEDRRAAAQAALDEAMERAAICLELKRNALARQNQQRQRQWQLKQEHVEQQAVGRRVWEDQFEERLEDQLETAAARHENFLDMRSGFCTKHIEHVAKTYCRAQALAEHRRNQLLARQRADAEQSARAMAVKQRALELRRLHKAQADQRAAASVKAAERRRRDRERAAEERLEESMAMATLAREFNRRAPRLLLQARSQSPSLHVLLGSPLCSSASTPRLSC